MGRKPVSQMNAKEKEAYEAFLQRKREKNKKEPKQPKTKKVGQKYSYNAHVADFETSTMVWYKEKGYTEIWGWSITDCHINSDNPIDMTDKAIVHTNAGGEEDVFLSFLEHLKSPIYKDKDKIYFHNLKFDGNFLLYNLTRLGFKDVTNETNCKKQGRKKVNEKTFSAVVSAGSWYCIKVNIGNKTLEFRDSAKRIQMSVRQMAKEFDLPILKGDIDYNRDPSLPITDHERKYMRNDVLIVAEVLRQQYREGFKEITTASFAFRSYKDYLKSKDLKFDELFPELDPYVEDFVRASYDGGEVYANYRFSGRIVGNPTNPNIIGFTWDINSMYPAVMSAMPMPYGKPRTTSAKKLGIDRDKQTWRIWRGTNKRYFIQVRKLVATVKPGRLPSVGVVVGFGKRKYAEKIILHSAFFADVRFERILEDYEIEEMTLGTVIWFKARDDLFYDYIKDIVAEKNTASIEKNVMRKAMAKVKMNSLYGKFGQKSTTISCFFYFDENDEELVSTNYTSECGCKYVPIAAIVTAEARELLISQANKFGSAAVTYMDTDSIHVIDRYHSVTPYRRRPMPKTKDEKLSQMNDVLPQEDLRRMLIEFEEGRPNEVWCDEFDLGAFKVEGSFATAKWLRAKTYIEGTIASQEDIDYFFSVKNDPDKEWDEEWFLIPEKEKDPQYYLKGCIKGAGIPDAQKFSITYNNFEIGLEFTGKLMPKKVKGGVVLVESEYKIKDDGTVLTNPDV